MNHSPPQERKAAFGSISRPGPSPLERSGTINHALSRASASTVRRISSLGHTKTPLAPPVIRRGPKTPVQRSLPNATSSKSWTPEIAAPRDATFGAPVFQEADQASPRVGSKPESSHSPTPRGASVVASFCRELPAGPGWTLSTSMPIVATVTTPAPDTARADAASRKASPHMPSERVPLLHRTPQQRTWQYQSRSPAVRVPSTWRHQDGSISGRERSPSNALRVVTCSSASGRIAHR